MKNPIKYFKHLVKDPINTIEEANARKKEIMPWLYGSIAVAVVANVLPGIISALSFLSIFGIIGVFGVMFFGFLLFIIKKAKEKFAALTCNGCNTMATFTTQEDFNKFVSYTASEDVATYAGISHPASKDGVVSNVDASAASNVTVSITLTCPNCGQAKHLKYNIVPFKCSMSEKKVLVRDLETVKFRLETAVKEVVKDYNDPDKRKNIPYTIQSVHHPDYENRTKPQTGSTTYNGVKIGYRRDVDELVEGFFIHNELNGKIIDLDKPSKK